jgi:hypothetical protein
MSFTARVFVCLPVSAWVFRERRSSTTEALWN